MPYPTRVPFYETVNGFFFLNRVHVFVLYYSCGLIGFQLLFYNFIYSIGLLPACQSSQNQHNSVTNVFIACASMMQLQTFQVNHVFSIAKGLHIFSLLQSMFSSVVHLVFVYCHQLCIYVDVICHSTGL